MTELDFAKKIAHRLDTERGNMSQDVSERLFKARQLALQHHRPTGSALLSLPGFGHFATDVVFPKVRMTAFMLALVAGVAGAYTFNTIQRASELEDVDTALLSGELPVNAYLDHGFEAWLKSGSQD